MEVFPKKNEKNWGGNFPRKKGLINILLNVSSREIQGAVDRKQKLKGGRFPQKKSNFEEVLCCWGGKIPHKSNVIFEGGKIPRKKPQIWGGKIPRKKGQIYIL